MSAETDAMCGAGAAQFQVEQLTDSQPSATRHGQPDAGERILKVVSGHRQLYAWRSFTLECLSSGAPQSW